MAVTLGTITRIKLSPQNWMTITPVTLDSSYATGGEALTANQLGLDKLTQVVGINCDDGYSLAYDSSNSKLMAFTAVAGLTETHSISTFNDGGAAAGTAAFTNTVPAGSHVLGWKCVVNTACTGNTSAVIKLGVAGDDDRFSADTAQSVFATGTVGAASIAADVRDTMATALTPLITVTSADDFSAVATTGNLTITVNYVSTNGKLIEAAVGTDLSAVVGTVTAIGR